MELHDLLAPVAGESGIEDALESWRWLVADRVRPFVATALGDLFVLDGARSVWLLDIHAGTFGCVAQTEEEWEQKLRDQEFVDRCFTPALVLELRDAGTVLCQGECYVPHLEPVLGGTWTIENWSPGNWVSHLERQGRVHFAIKDLPDGTIITKWNYTEL